MKMLNDAGYANIQLIPNWVRPCSDQHSSTNTFLAPNFYITTIVTVTREGEFNGFIITFD
jgi:hypothetical protein